VAGINILEIKFPVWNLLYYL